VTGSRGVGAVLALALGVLALFPRAASAQAEVEARLERSTISIGESVTLMIVVRGGGSADAPEFEVPEAVESVVAGRSQSFSWINGRSSSEVAFRYELFPRAEGRYSIGPFRIRVGGRTLEVAPVQLQVLAGAPAPSSPRTGQPGDPYASLRVDVSPAQPYVGQPAILRVRLVQSAPLAEDPRYTPPSTTGFWTERPSAPESYYGDMATGRVLVTETRTRVYPLETGVQTVGPASAILVLHSSGSRLDPFGWFGGSRRAMEVRSDPVRVRVRPLPAGAPAGFSGAVGSYQASWSADAMRASQDQPISLRLAVRGNGNLPLLRAPALSDDDFDILAPVLEDSLAAAGSLGSGRRVFRWTLLPRRSGTLTLPSPQWGWFDPASERYRTLELDPLRFEVGPAVSRAEDPGARWPNVFVRHGLDPWQRPANPWLALIAGAMLGVAIWLARSGARAAPEREAVAQRASLLKTLSRARGAEFWAAADEALAWLRARGHTEPEVERVVAAARYGRESGSPQPVYDALKRAMDHAIPGAGGRVWRWALAGVLIVGGVAVAVAAAPWPGGGRGRDLAIAADRLAQSGDLGRAERAWDEMWRNGSRAPGLAARRAWGELAAGQVAAASAWILRGEAAGEPDPALSWVRERVHEAGGLSGTSGSLMPLGALAWSAAALLCLVLAGVWRSPRVALACLVAGVMCASAPIVDQLWRSREPRAVVLREVGLEGTSLSLEPGRVVVVRQRSGERAQVRAGRGVEGWVRADHLLALGPS
jgi:BatD DUF11 like domain